MILSINGFRQLPESIRRKLLAVEAIVATQGVYQVYLPIVVQYLIDQNVQSEIALIGLIRNLGIGAEIYMMSPDWSNFWRSYERYVGRRLTDDLKPSMITIVLRLMRRVMEVQ